MQLVVGDIAELVRRAKSHDRTAFTDLYRFAVTPVYRYLAARVTPAEAEDLTQEVFLAALHGIDGLRATDDVGFLGWLFQIARHKLADHLRRKARHAIALPDEAVDLEDPDRRPDEIAEASAERDLVRAALDRLTPEQREVVICKYVLGYDNQQTARLIGKNPNAVNQLHHRALASLHRLIGRDKRES